MATISETKDYPTSDGKPMAETETHRKLMVDLIEALEDYYAGDRMTCVSGNLLMYYERGDKRRHVSPDVFVVRGVPKQARLNYLVWEEGKAPDFVIELSSKSTRKADRTTKWNLYRDVLRVAEYFLFDPLKEYLRPQLQGYRLHAGEYVPIEAVSGRLPSEVTGLHLESAGDQLRLFEPSLGRWLPTWPEKLGAAEERLGAAEEKRRREQAARLAVEAENERLRREIEALRRQSNGG